MSGSLLDEEPGPSETTRILIVDDLPEKLLVFQTVLQELGQEIVCVNSGSEALREVLKHEFAVILLDVNMPDIDGFETASLIRQYKRSAHTPIIFITSYADEMQTMRGYSLGAVDYIQSPVMPDVLRSKVRVFVDLHVLQRRLRKQADERVSIAKADAARQSAEAATQRSEYLSHASRILNDSLDVRVGMRRLLELLVPHMAHSVTVAMIPDQVGEPKPLSGQTRGPYSAVRDFVSGAYSSGIDVREHTIEELAIECRAAFAQAMVLRQVLHLPEGSPCRAVVPLVTGDRSVGGLLIHRLREPTDWRTVEELASRAAIAFENARLYRSLQVEIDDRRLAEARLQESSRRKDEFLAMLSHELRNPLAPIRNALEVIRRVAPPDPKLKWATDVTGRQITHLTRLVDELLDVARISQGKIALQGDVIDLRSVVAHAVETARPFIDAHSHELTLKTPDTPVWLRGDSARLAQVVGNLLHNAAKYTPDGGRIQLSLSTDAGRAMVRITDNGMGIEPELLPNVFELFEQGKRSLDRSQGGLGVGLTLVQRLVQLHHGRVEAHSAGAGHGAEFRVLLPCLSDVQMPMPQPEAVPLPPSLHGGYRVLVVDDNRDAAETTAVFLQVAGHEVKAVHDGNQALACVHVFAPDVVVLDIGLPGIDGYEVARRLRAMPETARSFLVAVTGYGRKDDRDAAMEAGFDEHLMKPAEPARLIELIGTWRPVAANPRFRPAVVKP
jgi:signal transduction histidine kinase/DNA-binding response OmpR family regulator